ncbi:thioredoxin family protein [Pelobacter seleniigenes]|uniref:thioredoxin family protein n=1 Tax=Pelobacter seleniigenes TaxID=407188 RepID=UPI0004A73952|nr:thioredoxin family protein [Pelobacter seleniigenes]
MRIDILCKPGHPETCQNTVENVREALSKLGVEAEVHQYNDSKKMIDNRIYVVPALMIDDQVRIAGRVPAVDEIVNFIAERPRYLKDVAIVA